MTDTERLNWIDENQADITLMVRTWYVRMKVGDGQNSQGATSAHWSGPNLREVIDRAASGRTSLLNQQPTSIQPQGGTK